MKKYKIIALGLILGIGLNSCTDYLDVSENSGLTSEEIYTSYSNMTAFLEAAYTGDKLALSTPLYNLNITTSFPLEMASSTATFHLDQTTDLYTASKSGGSAASFIKGTWGSTSQFLVFYNSATNDNYRPLFKAMFNVIRVVNTVIENADQIIDAPDKEDVYELKAEAHFLRAYAHFCVGRIWGTMPYITDVMASDDWDRERLPVDEFFQAIADDLDVARGYFEKAGLMRRDPLPGVAGNLADDKQSKPNGVAAVALKSRVLLYRASPLYNTEENNQYWIDAAEAAAEALSVAEEYGYELQSMENYALNFCGSFFTNEHIWAYEFVSGWRPRSYTNWGIRTMLGDAMTTDGGNGTFPTQNLVDMYDTKWGDVLVTEADRTAAATKGHYDDTDPYTNRDPRLATNIYYNQCDLTWSSNYCASGEEANKFNCYYTIDDSGSRVYSTFAKGFSGDVGDCQTGYIQRKRTNDYHKANGSSIPEIPEVLIRYAELYLNYAEAVNEAYGPNGTAPSGTMTALAALNVIRNRVSSDMVINAADATVADQASFRERVQKERTVELDQETNHRYYDIRRWKIAPTVLNAPKYGMLIKMVDSDTSKSYSERFQHTRVELNSIWQGSWNDKMYYWPFAIEDYFLYEKFDTSLNPYW